MAAKNGKAPSTGGFELRCIRLTKKEQTLRFAKLLNGKAPAREALNYVVSDLRGRSKRCVLLSF